jgi:hypothetical protein
MLDDLPAGRPPNTRVRADIVERGVERADAVGLTVTKGCTAIAMTRGTISPSRYSVSNWRFSIASNSGTETFISK